MEKFITIAVFDYIHEIQILKHRLDQENYSIFLKTKSCHLSHQCIPTLRRNQT
jgi:hypothetical protein